MEVYGAGFSVRYFIKVGSANFEADESIMQVLDLVWLLSSGHLEQRAVLRDLVVDLNFCTQRAQED